MSSFELKVGDSFHFPLGRLTQKSPGGEKAPVDITGATFLSQVRDIKDNLIASCPITIVDGPSGHISMSPVDSTGWPLGRLFWDIQMTRGGVTTSSRTVEFTVIKDISKT